MEKFPCDHRINASCPLRPFVKYKVKLCVDSEMQMAAFTLCFFNTCEGFFMTQLFETCDKCWSIKFRYRGAGGQD